MQYIFSRGARGATSREKEERPSKCPVTETIVSEQSKYLTYKTKQNQSITTLS